MPWLSPQAPPPHDENLLGSPEGVDGLTDEEVTHCINEGVLIHAGEVDEEASKDVGADVTCSAVVATSHENIVGTGKGFHGSDYNFAENAAKIC